MKYESILYCKNVSGVAARRASAEWRSAWRVQPRPSAQSDEIDLNDIYRASRVPSRSNRLCRYSTLYGLGPAGTELDCRDFMYHSFSASHALHITCKHPYRPRGREGRRDRALRAVSPPSSSRQSVPMALEATTRTAGGLRTDLGTWPPGLPYGPLPPTRPSPARAGRRAASAVVLRHARDEGGW